MATIRKEIVIDAEPADVWAALRDFGAVHERLVRGFVIDTWLEGETRVVTFFNGAVAREALVGIDDEARRLAYTVTESRLGFTHYGASAQVFTEGPSRTRLVWIVDLLPNQVASTVEQLMDAGAAAMKRTLDS